jgi:hypothetical protein
MWCVFAFMTLNKFHHGVLFGFIGVIFEMTWIFPFMALPHRQKIRSLASKMVCPILLFLLALIALRFNFERMHHCLTIPRTPWEDLAGLMTLVLDHFTSELPFTALQGPKFGYLFISLLSIGGFAHAYTHSSWTPRLMRIGIFMALFFGINVFQFSVSGEGITGAALINLYLILLVCITLLCNLSSANKFLTPFFIISMVLFLTLFSFDYAKKGLRKGFSEVSYGWVTAPANSVQVQGGFFEGVWVMPDQAEGIKLFEKISMRLSNRKVFFGPEFEMFYPATNRIQPKGMPLWSHPGVSITYADYRSFAEIFQKEDYDLIILSRPRGGLSPYVQISANNYLRYSLPQFPLYEFFLKKSMDGNNLFE